MSDSNFNLYGDVCAPSDDFLYGQEGYATEDDGSTYGVDYRRKDLPKESPKEELGADGIDKSDQQEGSFSEKSAPADNQLLIGDGDEATQRQPAEVVAGLDPAIPTADGIDNAEGFRSVDGVRDSDEIAPRGSVPVPDDSVGSDLQRSAMSASVVTGSTLKNESPGAVVKTGFESAQPRALILEDLNWVRGQAREGARSIFDGMQDQI